MNELDILSMVAERELDALVSEKIFGQPVTCHGEDSVHVLDRLKVGYLIPNYCTDILAAWQVVEELRGKGLCATINTFPDFWEVSYYKECGDLVEGFSNAALPVAICKAALLAMIEIEDNK